MPKYLRIEDTLLKETILLNKRYVLYAWKRLEKGKFEVIIKLSEGVSDDKIKTITVYKGLSEEEAENRLNEVRAQLEED